MTVDADLQIEDPSGCMYVVKVQDGRGQVVVPRSALRYRSLRALAPDRGRRIADVQRLLEAAGVALEVICDGQTLARVSAAEGGNWLARVLRLGPIHVRLVGLLAALVLRGRRGA